MECSKQRKQHVERAGGPGGDAACGGSEGRLGQCVRQERRSERHTEVRLQSTV